MSDRRTTRPDGDDAAVPKSKPVRRRAPRAATLPKAETTTSPTPVVALRPAPVAVMAAPDGATVRAERVDIVQGGADTVHATHVSVSQGGVNVANAEQVDVRQGGIARVTATDVAVSQGGIAFARADRVSVELGGIGLAIAGDARVSQGMARTVVARDLYFEQGLIGTAVTGKATFVRSSGVFLLVAKDVEGDVKAVFDWRGALAFGAVVGLLLAVFRRR